MELDYEQLRMDLDQLERPVGLERRLRWVVPDELGIARAPSGQLEVFLQGGQIEGQSPLMRRHLQYGGWQTVGSGKPFEATRILLPSAPHFISIAAMVAVELVRAGLGSGRDVTEVFRDVEPLIELAIRRGALSEDTIVGLIGELTLLRYCLIAGRSQALSAPAILKTWNGWREGRDFLFSSRSVEVKTTRRNSSRHSFSGLHQIEEQPISGGELEELYLFSVGYEAGEDGESLPKLVAQIANVLAEENASLDAEFLHLVETYGAPDGAGYRHASMADWSPYQTRYTPTFAPRLYRVRDRSLRLLSRTALEETYLLPDSLLFEAEFPDRVSPTNPVPNWQQTILSMLEGLPS